MVINTDKFKVTMAKLKEMAMALKLRCAGKSYSEIQHQLKVSKSTLSIWLRNKPLSAKRLRQLRDWNPIRISNYKETRRKKREALLDKIYKTERQRIFPLSQRDLLIAGLFLYWGEGAKTKMSWFSLSNTDPSMIRFFVCWLQNVLKVDKSRIKIRLHLYKDMNISKEIDFWSYALGIPKVQFGKPYIKTTSYKSITYKTFGHGTCNVIVANATLTKQILMGIKALQNQFQ